MEWNPPPKPAMYAEYRLVEAILKGQFPTGSFLPAERELSNMLGVTRPTLREALQRLSRDGWLEIQQGKPTRVKNYLQEGNLAVLGALATHSEHLPPDFIHDLLVVRLLIAPTYIRLAVENAPSQVIDLLTTYTCLEDTPKCYAAADWELHHRLSILSGNPVFTLIMNGFANLYPVMAQRYFTLAEARAASRAFYTALLDTACRQDSQAAFNVADDVMRASLDLWQVAPHMEEN